MATNNGNEVLWTESVTTMAKSSLRRMHVHVLQHDEGMMNACFSKNSSACVYAKPNDPIPERKKNPY